MRITPILIIHYTYEWTKKLLDSYEKFMDKKILVFNNNPLPGQVVKKTRGFWGNSREINKLCQHEVQLVKSHKLVQNVINCANSKDNYVEKLFTHGDVLDFVFPYCEKEYDAIILLEPDCVITGNNWWWQFEDKLENHWIVGSNRLEYKDSVTRFCPSAWRLKEVNDYIKKNNLTFNKYSNAINTGQKIMKECFCHMSYIEKLEGIKHLGGGSSKHFASNPNRPCKMI